MKIARSVLLASVFLVMAGYSLASIPPPDDQACRDCLKGCDNTRDDKKKTCDKLPNEAAKINCNGEADWDWNTCTTDCKSNNGCDSGNGGGGGDGCYPFSNVGNCPPLWY